MPPTMVWVGHDEVLSGQSVSHHNVPHGMLAFVSMVRDAHQLGRRTPSGIIRWPLFSKRQTSRQETRPPRHIAVKSLVSRVLIGTTEEKPNSFFFPVFPHERSWRMTRQAFFSPIHYP